MKVLHLISGGDSGGAKTHVHSLLQNLSKRIDITMVCFMEGPFSQEARELGIHTIVLPGHNLLHNLRTLKELIRTEGFEILHCHGARGNMMGALLRRSTACPWSPPSTPTTAWTTWAVPSPASPTAPSTPWPCVCWTTALACPIP